MTTTTVSLSHKATLLFALMWRSGGGGGGGASFSHIPPLHHTCSPLDQNLNPDIIAAGHIYFSQPISFSICFIIPPVCPVQTWPYMGSCQCPTVCRWSSVVSATGSSSQRLSSSIKVSALPRVSYTVYQGIYFSRISRDLYFKNFAGTGSICEI